MQAMACNRCKKTTVESIEGWSTLRGTGLETVVEKKYLQIDLCPECTDSFRIWYLRLQPTEVTDKVAEEKREARILRLCRLAKRIRSIALNMSVQTEEVANLVNNIGEGK